VADSIWHGTALRHSTRSTNSNSHCLQNFYKSVTQYGRSRSVPSLTPTLTSRHHHSTCSLAQIQRLVKTYDLSISSSCWTAVDGVQSLSVGISDGAESSSSAVCDLNTNRGAAATRSPIRRNGDRRNAARRRDHTRTEGSGWTRRRIEEDRRRQRRAKRTAPEEDRRRGRGHSQVP